MDRVSTKSNGVPQSMLKTDSLDSTEVEAINCTAAEVVGTKDGTAVEDSPHRDAEGEGQNLELQDVNLNQSPSQTGAENVRGHSPNPDDSSMDMEGVLDSQSTGCHDSLSQPANDNSSQPARTSIPNENQSSQECSSSKADTGASNHRQAHEDDTSETHNASEDKTRDETRDERICPSATEETGGETTSPSARDETASPSAEEAGDETTSPSAEDETTSPSAEEAGDETTSPSAEEAGATSPSEEETGDETTSPAAEEAGDKTTSPLAEEAGDEATSPSAKEAGDETTSPSAKEAGDETMSPLAEEAGDETTSPSAKEAGDETMSPSAEETGDETTNPSAEETPVSTPPASADSPDLSEDDSISPASSSDGCGAANEIPAVTQAVTEADKARTEPQTSFVNEYALSSSESPTYEVDRSLEQFSEILLDSDPSDGEAQAVEDNSKEVTANNKAKKRVRFADEVANLDGSGHGRSPPPPPSSLPTHPSPEPSSKHPGVPITPSPTSPKNKAPCPRFTVDELINGVELPAEYLGSTPIILDGLGAMKTARMFQAQQAVQLIKDPESESHPHFAVKLKISTGSIRIADGKTDVDLMDHPLHTITYVADIDHVLVIMAHVRPPLLPNDAPHCSTNTGTCTANGAGETTEGKVKFIPKMTCHVLDSSNAREAAMVIGQAFSAAYKQFLRSSGISEQQLEQAEYTHILNAQSVPKLEVESLGDRNKIKKLTLAKHKNDIMGLMVMESGYGSAIPACVIVHLSKTGSASKCGLLNIGDHILSINGVNLVGMPKKACVEQIKKCRYINVVKMEVCSCPTVVDVTIVRPDLKFQLGFSVHEGTICSLVRGSIAERSGVRIGHSIIDINGTSTVGMQHSDVVHLLSSTVGDLHIRMMPDILYKLLTGKLQPEYC